MNNIVKIIGAIIILIVVYYSGIFVGNLNPHLLIKRKKTDIIAEEMKQLFETMKKSSKKMQTIQDDLETRIESLYEIIHDAKAAEEFIALNDKQVDAIDRYLGHKLEKSESSNVISSAMVSGGFFILGAVFTWLLSLS